MGQFQCAIMVSQEHSCGSTCTKLHDYHTNENSQSHWLTKIVQFCGWNDKIRYLMVVGDQAMLQITVTHRPSWLFSRPIWVAQVADVVRALLWLAVSVDRFHAPVWTTVADTQMWGLLLT